MEPLELAERYVDKIFGSKDLDGLEAILDPGVRYSGPMFAFASAADYISSLKESPPDGF
ncbi:MAG: hypothetical protein OEZ32_11760 [Nitrospinota bacterium]|nr:hypothetical protein [Nitrospinota bacterium]